MALSVHEVTVVCVSDVQMHVCMACLYVRVGCKELCVGVTVPAYVLLNAALRVCVTVAH